MRGWLTRCEEALWLNLRASLESYPVTRSLSDSLPYSEVRRSEYPDEDEDAAAVRQLAGRGTFVASCGNTVRRRTSARRGLYGVRMRRSALVVRGRLAQHLNGCDVHTVSMWRSVAASEATNHTLRTT
jgi:hypothetical protein